MSFTSLGVRLLACAVLASAIPVTAAEAPAGKKLFRAQCALCHSAESGDNGGAQGPSLAGVFGRQAARETGFAYTPALRESNLTWNVDTLQRFLASPTTLVPGSAMVVAVPARADRDNLIAYFRALKVGTYKDPAPPPAGPPDRHPSENMDRPPKSGEDWKLDTPGRVHHIQADQLPPPFDTRGARNPPKFVEKPANASLKLPPGFDVEVFASGLTNPRNMRLAPNGDIILVESSAGRVKVLRPSADGRNVASADVFAQGLNYPFGIALYPAGANPQWLYVGELNRVVRYAYNVGDTAARGIPEVVIPELAPDPTGGHITRDLAFSPDGKRLYVSIGSQSNGANDMSRKTPAQVKTWESQETLGASWDMETKRATVFEFEVGADKAGRYFATGIRNCVGLTLQPETSDLWCTVNERDMLGDDLVPDYSTRVRDGGFYGWPWYYIGTHEDPWLKGQRPDLAGKALVPDVLYQAHSAPITLTFYPRQVSGASAFPDKYRGDGFAVLHGSWNRAFRTGHKVVRLLMKGGVPTGAYEDFMVGFITDDGNMWGRPSGSVVAADGSLLVSEDFGGLIYRISYRAGIEIAGNDISPESITSVSDGTLIVGSGRRTIYRLPAGTAEAQPWIELPPDSPPTVFGVLADEASNTLWACASTWPPTTAPPRSALYAFDLGSGLYKQHYPLPSVGAICNDIAVGGDGSVYATDTINMEVLRLAPRARSLKLWAGKGAFGPKGGALDGIAVLGSRVIVNTIGTNKLFAVDIGKRGKAGDLVELTLDRPIQKPDGMRASGASSVVLAENGNPARVSRVEIQGDRATVTPIDVPMPRGTNAVTETGNALWALEGRPVAVDGATRHIRAVQIESR